MGVGGWVGHMTRWPHRTEVSVLSFQGGGDGDPDGREKGDPKDKASPFEEDKSGEMKVGEEGDASKSNGRGLLNGMDRDCKDFK